jgi:hypothetical protein
MKEKNQKMLLFSRSHHLACFPKTPFFLFFAFRIGFNESNIYQMGISAMIQFGSI